MAEEEEDKKPWDRGEGGAFGETSRSYEVFLAFLKLGPWRSLLKVYNAVYRSGAGQQPAKHPPRHIQAWSVEYKWQARADAYDDWTRQKSITAWERKRFEARDRLIMSYLDPLMDAALSLALGYDIGVYRDDGIVIPYKAKSPYQVQILKDLLSRAGLDETIKAEIAHKSGKDPWEEVRAILEGIKDGSKTVEGTDPRKLIDLYLSTVKGGGEDTE